MTAESPEDWRPDPDRDDVEEALEEIEREAANHNAESAAGMRLARSIVEQAISGSGPE